MRISDWSSDVCSSDLSPSRVRLLLELEENGARPVRAAIGNVNVEAVGRFDPVHLDHRVSNIGTLSLDGAIRISQKLVAVSRILERLADRSENDIVKHEFHFPPYTIDRKNVV